MSNFSVREIEFLRAQSLGRLATMGASGELHVVPLRFELNLDSDTIDLGGFNLAWSKKYRDVQETGKAAFVVDDRAGPGLPCGVEIRGTAHVIPPDALAAEFFRHGIIRLVPSRILSWGVDTDALHPSSRRVRR